MVAVENCVYATAATGAAFGIATPAASNQFEGSHTARYRDAPVVLMFHVLKYKDAFCSQNARLHQ